MKNIKDAIAEARQDKNYKKYLEAARVRVRLAVRVYDKRKEKGLSQKELAKQCNTTQKIISNIENADVNIGIDLLNRLAKILDFSSEDFGIIFHRESILSFDKWSPQKNTSSAKNFLVITN